jgi:ATP-dependent Clp protease ATP-binding subunit ClpA
MFERFTKQARQVVLAAVAEAERDESDSVTPQHLLLALLDHGPRSAPVLTKAGLTRERLQEAFATAHRQAGLSQAEAEALTHLGIDLPTVIAQIEATHGPNALAPRPRRPRHPLGHIPFTPESKSVLTNALAQAQSQDTRHITDEHFLLALTATPTRLPAQILATHGLTHQSLRTHLSQAS